MGTSSSFCWALTFKLVWKVTWMIGSWGPAGSYSNKTALFQHGFWFRGHLLVTGCQHGCTLQPHTVVIEADIPDWILHTHPSPSSRQIFGILSSNLHKAKPKLPQVTRLETPYLIFFILTYNRALGTQSFSWKSHGAAVQCAHYIARNTSTLSSHPPHIHIPRPGISSPHPLRSITSRARGGETRGQYLGQDTMTATELLHF